MSEVRTYNRQKALEALKIAGQKGCTTEQLLKVAGSRFGGRLFELRQQGHDIETRPRHGTECACYVYHGWRHPGQLGLFENLGDKETRAML